MLLPRFSIRTALAAFTGCALVCLFFGMAARGEPWAWIFSGAVIALLVTICVHASIFGLVWIYSLWQPDEPQQKPREGTS